MLGCIKEVGWLGGGGVDCLVVLLPDIEKGEADDGDDDGALCCLMPIFSLSLTSFCWIYFPVCFYGIDK